ncbi:A/G-specific adenine glycosylase [Desulfopila sp. IMCC35006]|uniref:A/G-specific adenine glycosylase n=1 Tax=Desulfopila sp. IMCC35006 TaxID=2569542 RepID=UPI0010AB92BC|nr:A/G-specific adenine glycosylase [Desulfopila sp. IMCC35006]TKB27305.1 A/G-specific adenine glycosylase [Desulfopila sp. IMCC35006]
MNGGFSKSEQLRIAQPLLDWFRRTRRDLPWRRTYDPYHVWISEIMLQQTQMDRGVAYFLRWIERFADVRAVAAAEEQEILKYWEGLGYYARARNLHKAAKVMVLEYGGKVPCEYEQLLRLPGIGPYTAAAVASVAGNYDVPVIDANVTRVYARLFDIGEPVKERPVQKRLAEIAENLLPRGQARAYNQALMDLGGLVCTPKNPSCSQCPIAAACAALALGTVTERPVIGPGKRSITIHKVAGIIGFNKKIYIQQRQADDVWGGLWEFPGGQVEEGKADDRLAAAILQDTGLVVVPVEFITRVMHQYTHHKIILDCFWCRLTGDNCQPVLHSACDYRWIDPLELGRFAFPAGPRKLLKFLTTRQPALFDGHF